jgi:hypothetical protein
LRKEVEIKEIIRPKEETAALQCIWVARKWGDEWVSYEEDHSDQIVCKLQWTIDDLMGQIKVKAWNPDLAHQAFDQKLVLLILHCVAEHRKNIGIPKIVLRHNHPNG